MYKEHVSGNMESQEITTAVNKIMKGRPLYFSTIDGNRETETPLYLMMNVETSCSYRCPKCALNSERKTTRGTPLTIMERKLIIEKAKETGIRSFVIAGLGEPTEHFEQIRPLIETACNEGMTTILFSTLNGLSAEQTAFMRDHDVSVIVSLDSLNPETYRKLTGNGNIQKIMGNISMIRTAYDGTINKINGDSIVRLGIDMTIVIDNEHEIDAMRSFAGDDMQLIVNPPMKRGRFNHEILWEKLVGDNYERFANLAKEKSETGGSSTISEGVCGYFSRGISVDTDGQLMTCAYAGESVDAIRKNIRSMIDNPEDQKNHLAEIRNSFDKFTKQLGYLPACPVRNPQAPRLYALIGKNRP